jgi:phage baseplate assembly protein W
MEIQKYGIKYPFSLENNDNIFMDLNDTYEDGIKSQILHIIFTQKGHRLRNPEFGTNLIRFIFEPDSELTLEGIKNEITSSIKRWVSNVEFNNINIYNDPSSEYGKIVTIDYSIIKGKIKENHTVGVRI